MKCPHCENELTPEEIRTLWGAMTSSMRTTFGHGPGRPRWKKRCPCGAMTIARAKQRNHKCSPPVEEPKRKSKPKKVAA